MNAPNHIQILINDYDRKINTLDQMLTQDFPEEAKARIQSKKNCCDAMAEDLAHLKEQAQKHDC